MISIYATSKFEYTSPLSAPKAMVGYIWGEKYGNHISDDGDEPLGMPEDMEGVGRSPTRVQPTPEDV